MLISSIKNKIKNEYPKKRCRYGHEGKRFC